MRYLKSFKQGLLAEKSFQDAMEIKSIQVINSSEKDDIKNHIDGYFIYDGKKYSYDVKSLKKINRSDDKFDLNKIWIEFQNVNGDIGWLYGEADYICFEYENEFLCVNRKMLVQFCEMEVDMSNVYEEKYPYKLYSRSRYGRNDLTTIIEKFDLMVFLKKLNKGIGEDYFVLQK